MTRILFAAALAGIAFAASAQNTGAASAQGVGMTTQPTVEDPIRDDATTRDVRDHHCLRETGSLITTSRNQRALREARAKGEPTVTVPCADYGRAYTQDDINRTGAIDLSEALRQLDPTIH
jgi:hypothetical protein